MAKSVRTEKVIRVVADIGDGSKDNPFRVEVEYWTSSGFLIARFDINDDPMMKHRP